MKESEAAVDRKDKTIYRFRYVKSKKYFLKNCKTTTDICFVNIPIRVFYFQSRGAFILDPEHANGLPSQGADDTMRVVAQISDCKKRKMILALVLHLKHVAIPR